MLFLFIAVLVVGLIAIPFLARLARPEAARRLAFALAGSGAIIGWASLAWLVFAPTYRTETVTLSTGSQAASVTSASRSLLEVGLAPLTIIVLLGVCAAFAAILLGAFEQMRAPLGRGCRLMLACAVPLVAIGLVSWGLAPVQPAIALSAFATITAFASSGKSLRG